ncbi:MAG TPA: sterol-binding protein [Burkholderiales bacterium]|jgi:ubiquinone biosynthesis protein UbiJ|nr:sterol-binding protein [Burkholderiales bacterium]
MRFESPFAAGLNRLLESEAWARERLAPFAGEVIELRAPPLPALRLAIAADGRLAPAAPEAAGALVIAAGPGALAAAVQGEEQLLRVLEVTGNARLASEVMFLFRHLRWDAEEELSRWVGDIAAHRLAGVARRAAAWHADAARRVAGSLVEYAAEEGGLLVRRGELAGLAAAQARLRDGLERLEKRIARLVAAGGS